MVSNNLTISFFLKEKKMANREILDRKNVLEENKWRLEDLYESDQLWEAEFTYVNILSDELYEFKGVLGNSAENLLRGLDKNTEISRYFEKVYVYAHMKSHEDTGNPVYQALASRADMLAVNVNTTASFLVPEIISISDEVMVAYIEENKALANYNRFLKEIRRVKPHILSTAEENIMAMAGEVLNSSDNVFNMLNNADIKFDSIKNEEGEEVELTKGRYITFMESQNRKVREDAFNSTYAAYDKQKNTLAALLNSRVRSNIFSASVRKYDSCRHQSLFADNIEAAVYDNLIDTIHDNLGLMYRYMEIRKKIMNLDQLHMYDIYTPMVKNIDMKIEYKEAVDTVKSGVAPLGEKYLSDLKKAFTDGWIDVYENRGKRGGAYSWGCYDSHPYILLNHNDTINSMFTIAHELGHAMHSYYSDKTQPYIDAQYKIFVAEVASTLNEFLLMNHLLGNTTDKNKKLYLINYFMEQFRTTVYRQTMFAEFEKIIHERAEAGEPLTADLLCNIYRELNELYYGNDVIIDKPLEMEWARIPHFYSSFYVYKYATGFSAAVSLGQGILEEGASAVEKYLEFLKSGASDYPLELLKKAGVDMTTAAPINKALKVFEGLLDQMEALIIDK